MSFYINKHVSKKRKINDNTIIIDSEIYKINNPDINNTDNLSLLDIIINTKNKNNNKRKINVIIKDKSKKLKKNNYCSIHENQEICNIYECSGCSHFITNINFMPYII